MTDWSRVSHAYGTAHDIPALLDGAGSEPTDEVLGELWSRLRHQGTVYTASYAALRSFRVDQAITALWGRAHHDRPEAAPLDPASKDTATRD
jgi:hypothetical protein